MPEYPKELLWNGRSIEPVFEPDELLFYRVQGFDPEGMVNVDDILFPNTSINRGRFSLPQHVLWSRYPKYTHWKVAQFRVQDIPEKVEQPNSTRVFNFKAVHDPLIKTDLDAENYAHTEIQGFENGERKKNISNALVAKDFRMRLRRMMYEVSVPPIGD
jgi:hypothetical protein